MRLFHGVFGTLGWHRTSISLLKGQDSSQLSYEGMICLVPTGGIEPPSAGV